jgi:hypothetical protein
MFTRAGSITATAALILLFSASQSAAQIMVPTQAFENLSVVLESLRDDVILYMGDPQQLLLMKVRPDRFRPRVQYESQTNAVLLIRDLYVANKPQALSMTAAERDQEKDLPISEVWEVRLFPSGPTKFALQFERGKSVLDFTDFEVQAVNLKTDETELEVDFSRQNPIVMESFGIRAPGGSIVFQHMINARAKEMAIYIPDTVCDFEVAGKEFEGESSISFHGVPAEMRLAVTRKVGVRITAPAATLARFKAGHMTQSGDDLVSQNYEAAKCRIRLTFAEEIPRLAVAWK